jgi:transposase
MARCRKYEESVKLCRRLEQRKIRYCVKDSSGKVYADGSLPATRMDLDRSMKMPSQPWSAAIEATMSTGWIYDRRMPRR